MQETAIIRADEVRAGHWLLLRPERAFEVIKVGSAMGEQTVREIVVTHKGSPYKHYYGAEYPVTVTTASNDAVNPPTTVYLVQLDTSDQESSFEVVHVASTLEKARAWVVAQPSKPAPWSVTYEIVPTVVDQS